MQENRETSGVPGSDEDRGRSAKATSHKAGMYAPEESDCVEVPMNQPNKEDQPSAEVGEGRARTKENIAQSNTSPTQSGERVSQGLRGVQQAARARKQERFTALLHHLTVNLLRDNFYATSRRPSHSWASRITVGSAGVTDPSSSGGKRRRSGWWRSCAY
jgi:hypothetical protein